MHTPLPLPWSQDESLLEQPETGAAKHLALEQFQACDMPLHGSVAPGQGETGLDGGIIVSEPLSKPGQGYNGTLRDLGQPGIQVRALPPTHEAGKVLRQRDRLSHVGVDKKFKALLAPPPGAVHCTAERSTARRALVRGAAEVPWEDGGGMAHGIGTHRGGRDTCAAHTSPLRLHVTA